MASTTTIAIAEAIKEEMKVPLQGTTFSQTFTCKRDWLPVFDATELATLQLTSIPSGIDPPKVIARNRVEIHHRVQLWFQKTVSTTPADRKSQCDVLGAFIFEVVDYWLKKHHNLSPTVGSAGARVVSIYSPDDLASLNRFVGYLEISAVERPAT